MSENNILWLIRCTKYQYAKDFIDSGTIKFNTPEYWIEVEKKEGKGRGDIQEGIFASAPAYDFNKRLLYHKIRDNVVTENSSGNVIFRTSDILSIPCHSLFVLTENSFSSNYFVETNQFANTTKLVTKYFNDFYSLKSREEIDKLDQNERPVVLLIQSPQKYIDRIKLSLKKIGFGDDEILIDFVKYVDKSNPFLSTMKFPNELFLKDISFKHQSELRIVLNCKSKKILDQFKKNDYFLRIGPTDDFAIIHDYYLEDMLIEKRGNELLYNLPKPIITEINMNIKEEVQKVLMYLVYDKYHDVEQVIDAQNRVKELIDYYYEKFNEHIQVPIEFWLLGKKK